MNKTKACSKCGKVHNDFPPNVNHGTFCKACWNEYHRGWSRRNNAKIADYARRRYRKLKTHEPEKLRAYQRISNLSHKGVTVQWYRSKFEEQGGACAICGDAETNARNQYGPISSLSIDHDHGCCQKQYHCCGKCVRGLLCGKCNRRLEAIEVHGWLEKALAYLAKYPKRERTPGEVAPLFNPPQEAPKPVSAEPTLFD